MTDQPARPAPTGQAPGTGAPAAPTDGRPAHAAAPQPLVTATRALEDDARLDAAVGALRGLADRLVADRPRRDLLEGRVLGHALHPVLTDAPLGLWSSAVALDLLGGRGSRRAARRLVGLGVLATAPAVATGLAEWARTEPRAQRVGVVHAAANTVGLVLFAASWVARGRGHHGRGTGLALAGAAAAGVGGYLGGHLAIARNVGSRDEAYADSLPAAEIGALPVPGPDDVPAAAV